MASISNWFNSLDPTLRIYWGVAIFASVVFVIQTTMSFADFGDVDGGSTDADIDISTDTDSLDNDPGAMQLLSIRNMFYFLMGFGWAGISLWNTIPNRILLAVVSVLVGCLFVAAFVCLFRMMLKLQHNGAFDIRDAVGKVCSVYLRIPAAGQGQGKVQISFNGSVQELDALSEGQAIPSGTKVRVVRILDKNVLVVEPA